MTDREIDCAIAEKVMGWKPKGWVRLETFGTPTFLGRHDDVLQDTDAPATCECCTVFRLWDRGDGLPNRHGRKIIPDGHVYSTPPYSVDIAAAWEVVEKMRRDGCSIAIASSFNVVDAPWEVGWTDRRHTAPHGHVRVHATTAPRAICRAALAAVGVKVE